MKRRMFLKLLAFLGLAGPAALSSSCGSSGKDAGELDPDKVVAYKLSRRGHQSCNACKQHAQNKLFLTQAAADANRAHAGCNCRIKPVSLPVVLHGQFFVNGQVYDRRSSV